MKNICRGFAILTALALMCAPPVLAFQGDKVPLFEKNDKRTEALAKAQELSLKHLQDVIDKNGIKSLSDLKVKSVAVDGHAMAHTLLQQTYEGVPVWGGKAIVHLRPDGSFFAITDNFVPDIVVDITPQISSEMAIEKAMELASKNDECGKQPKNQETDLWVVRRATGTFLAYRVQVVCMDGAKEPTAPLYFINAQTSEVVFSYDNLPHISASGTSLYSGNVTFQTEPVPTGGFSLSNVAEKLQVKNGNGTVTALQCMLDSDNTWGDGTSSDNLAQRAASDVQFGSEKTYEYYWNRHTRDGLDGLGGPVTAGNSCSGISALVSGVYSGGTNNASWCPSSICTTPILRYGGGDGNRFSALVSLDVVGHEMTHGVTQYAVENGVGLDYEGESGALNESMSDVFGAMIELYPATVANSDTWKLGEDAYTPAISGDALRYLDNPHLGGQPDHYTERYTGTSDNGGVHINSGIPNKVFYLLVQGGRHHKGGIAMLGIGVEKAEKIWYRALDEHMVSSTNFFGALAATQQAAAFLYSSQSDEHKTIRRTVDEAWCLVGIHISDSDGDGVGDICDAFPSNGAETTDTDNDGIGNNADNDDDNDGVFDTGPNPDPCPLISGTTCSTDRGKVLLVDGTVSSPEAQAAYGAGFVVEFKTRVQWQGMTGSSNPKFSDYKAIIFGDNTVNVAASLTNNAWNKHLKDNQGNIVIIGGDPAGHSIARPGPKQFLKNAIEFVGSGVNPGLYLAISYISNDTMQTNTNTLLGNLTGYGPSNFSAKKQFSSDLTSINDAAHPVITGTSPPFSTLTDEGWSSTLGCPNPPLTSSTLDCWGQSIHSLFDTYPTTDFSVIAKETTSGIPYILARSASFSPITLHTSGFNTVGGIFIHPTSVSATYKLEPSSMGQGFVGAGTFGNLTPPSPAYKILGGLIPAFE